MGVAASEDRQQIKPSWIDRLIDRVESLPGPTWLLYALITILTILLNNAVLWIDGGLPVLTFDRNASLFGFYTLYWLGLYHYLGRYASKSLRHFRPLLDVDESDYRLIEQQLSYLPRAAGFWIIPLGIIITLVNVSGDISYLIGPVAETQKSTLPVIYYSVLACFLSFTFFALFIRTVRQLRRVGALHERATHIDLLNLDAPHAFSGLTSRTGMGLILLLILVTIPGDVDAITAFEAFFYFSIALLAVAVFVIPLEGMHRRLQDEKTRELGRLSGLLRTASERLHQKISKEEYDHMDQLKDAVQTLILERELVEKTSTWPWEPRTIRGFATSLFLPILLLVISRLIERVF